MNAEIIAIGAELLIGSTIDTNSVYIADELRQIGIPLLRKVTVGDDKEHISTALKEALSRSELIICMGGLGPTVDDMTREAVAMALDRPLEFQEELMEQIAAHFAARQRPMSDSNRRQAYMPQGARAIPNKRGSAPAFLIEEQQATIIVLPGVPQELRWLFETAVIPYLRDERGMHDVILVQTLYAVGLGESVIGERIADLMEQINPALGITAKGRHYELHMVAKASTREQAQQLLKQLEATLQERLGDTLVGHETLEGLVCRLLDEQNLTIALYEGNLLASVYRRIAAHPIGLARLRGILIHPLDHPTDESAATALAYTGALGVCDRWRSDIALGVQAAQGNNDQELTLVSIVLVTPTAKHELVKHYDLRAVEGWDFVATQALELVRGYLLQTL